MGTTRGMRRALLLAAVLFAGCGDERGPGADVPAWAQVAPLQLAAAREHGVPVAFENDLGMRFVLIPAGRFVMGSPEQEEDRRPDETRHEVVISKPFYLQVTEVTNGQYRRLEPEYDGGRYPDLRGDDAPGYSLNEDRQPVAELSHREARDFAHWLSIQGTGRTYRLPTEAEWEYACRAGTTTPYSWGDSSAQGYRYANADDPLTNQEFGFPWAAFAQDDGFRVTAPVGCYLPNPWGLQDMHGNVWEWCSDAYGPYPHGRVVDPTGAQDGPGHVVRGGSWFDQPDHLRSASRAMRSDDPRHQHRAGFRLVSPLPEPGGG